MARHIEGVSREQVMLLPERLDDYIGQEDLVRVIDRFVDRQDAIVLGFRAPRPTRKFRSFPATRFRSPGAFAAKPESSPAPSA